MKKLVLALFLLFAGFNLQATTNPPPPPGFVSPFLALLMEQIDNTNIVINPSTDKILKLRIKKDYEIFDAKGKLVLKGSGKEIDVSQLPNGKYTIKFDKDYNQIEYFTKK